MCYDGQTADGSSDKTALKKLLIRWIVQRVAIRNGSVAFWQPVAARASQPNVCSSRWTCWLASTARKSLKREFKFHCNAYSQRFTANWWQFVDQWKSIRSNYEALLAAHRTKHYTRQAIRFLTSRNNRSRVDIDYKFFIHGLNRRFKIFFEWDTDGGRSANCSRRTDKQVGALKFELRHLRERENGRKRRFGCKIGVKIRNLHQPSWGRGRLWWRFFVVSKRFFGLFRPGRLRFGHQKFEFKSIQTSNWSHRKKPKNPTNENRPDINADRIDRLYRHDDGFSL